MLQYLLCKQRPVVMQDAVLQICDNGTFTEGVFGCT